MIAYLKGIVAAKDADGVVIEAGGIGYGLVMSANALSQLPALGNTVQVWTYLQVKEDAFSLFGFSDKTERALFEKLISVSGIGPKMALSALSTMPAGELAQVISEGDVARIATVPGIGKKTAQRIVLELQGILRSDEMLLNYGHFASSARKSFSEASEALAAMGFSADEIASALKGIADTGQDTSTIVVDALKTMGG